MTEDGGAVKDLRDRLGRAEANIANLTSITAASNANIATLLASNAELRAEFRSTADQRRQDQIEFFAAQRDIAASMERKMLEMTARFDQRLNEFNVSKVEPLKEQVKVLGAKVGVYGAGGIIFVLVLKYVFGIEVPK